MSESSKKQTRVPIASRRRVFILYACYNDFVMKFRHRFFLNLIAALPFVLAVTFYARHMTAWTRWQEWSLKNITQAFDRGAGEDRIRPEVLLMKKLALRAKKSEFRLSGELQTSMWIRYPAIEFLYPLRINSNSSLVFSKKGDELLLTGKCTELDSEGVVILYECLQS